MTKAPIISLIFFMAGCVSASGTQPADSLRTDSLREVTVVAVGPVRTVTQQEDGRATLSRKGLTDAPSFMGSGDAIAMLRSMPSVSTSNDLQATMHVKGGANGSNSYFVDGMRIVNPLHMLGFYSAFNPDFFENYDFRSGYIPVTAQTTSGAILEAHSSNEVLSRALASASVGLIESHVAAGAPLVEERISLEIGGRIAYPSKIFPSMLEMGSSRLEYGFWDANLVLTSRLSDKDLLSFTAFADRDNMDVTNHRQGAKDGYFRWSNIAAGATFRHEDTQMNLYWSRYRNKLFLEQGGRRLDLPSGLDQISALYIQPLKKGWRIEADVNWHHTLGQHNSALTSRNGVESRSAVEVNAGAEWSQGFGTRFSIDAGIRMAFYHTDNYTSVMPQPRLLTKYKIGQRHYLSLSYQRQARFDRLIETSAGGLPSDFWTTASRELLPEDVHSYEICGGGQLPWIGGTFRIDLYKKRLLHATDYSGSVMDMLSPSYDGSSQIVDAHGWSRGIAVSIVRQFSRVRGRIGYSFGRTTLKSDHFGSNDYPASYDRTHDLNATVTWQPLAWLQMSASYVYATGLPYTRAKYGYMIGENLICEYYPHNSSRLPDYNRLDFSASWHHTNSHGLRQQVTLSVYNALGSRNVLFQYQSYSVSEGITNKSSVMYMLIPSITYSISFR